MSELLNRTQAGWATEPDRNVWHRYGRGADTAECGHEANGAADTRFRRPDEDAVVCGRCHLAPEDGASGGERDLHIPGTVEVRPGELVPAGSMLFAAGHVGRPFKVLRVVQPDLESRVRELEGDIATVLARLDERAEFLIRECSNGGTCFVERDQAVYIRANIKSMLADRVAARGAT